MFEFGEDVMSKAAWIRKRTSSAFEVIPTRQQPLAVKCKSVSLYEEVGILFPDFPESDAVRDTELE